MEQQIAVKQKRQPTKKPTANKTATGRTETPGRGAKHAKKAAGKINEPLLTLVERSLDDDKAVDVATIPLAGKTTIADYMVVASGRSQRQVGAMADHMVERLKAAGYGPVQVEGMPQNDWVLVDAGDVIVHLFRPEVRTFYNLEKMWAADFGEGERALG